MRTPLKLRASAQDRIRKCTGSAWPPDLPAMSTTEAADVGKMMHACLAKRILGGLVDPQAEALAQGVDPSEVGSLVGMAWKDWTERGVSALFPNPQAEQHMELCDEEFTLEGTTDVLSLVGDEVRILDWKSDRVEGEHSQQLLAYALLNLANSPNATCAHVTIHYVRTGQQDCNWYARETVTEWWRELKEELRQPARYQTGRHCEFCPRVLACPTREAMFPTAMIAMQEVLLCYSATGELPENVDLGQLNEFRLLVTGWSEKIHNLLRTQVANAPGKCLRLPGGRELRLVEQVSQSIDFPKAHQLLLAWRDLLSNVAVERRCSVSLTGLRKEVSAVAPYGQKGARMDELRQRLEAADALIPKTTERLVTVRADEPTPLIEGERP